MYKKCDQHHSKGQPDLLITETNIVKAIHIVKAVSLNIDILSLF